MLYDDDYNLTIENPLLSDDRFHLINRYSLSDKEKWNINQVPEYVTYEQRDFIWREKWLNNKFRAKLDDIKNWMKRLVRHHATQPSEMKYYTTHGISHFEGVERNIYRLIPGDKYALLSEYECFYLLGSAWLHDIGMFIEAIQDDINLSASEIRENHHFNSGKIIKSHYRLLGLEEHEAKIFALLARFHRKRENIQECYEIISDSHIVIRLQLLASYLRLADGLDIDQQRAPDEEYALSKTYGMPSDLKIHWIRSKLTSGIDIDCNKSKITVHLLYPSNLKDVFAPNELVHRENEFKNKIEKIYSMNIINDIRAELEGIKNILIKNNITKFIEVRHVVHHVLFEEKFLKDIVNLINADILFKSPSSSLLYDSYLKTLKNIFEEFNKKKTILSLTVKKDDQLENLHKDTLKLLKNANSDFEKAINQKRKCHFQILNLLKDINETISEKDSSAIDDIYNICERKVQMYSYYRDYLDLQKIEKSLEEMKKNHENIDKDGNILEFVNEYIHLLNHMFLMDKELIRFNSSKLLHKTTPKDYVWWIIKNYVSYKSKKIIESKFKTEDEEEKERDALKKFPHKLGILLYGYSSSVLSTLCGFRDTIIADIVKELNKGTDIIKGWQAISRYLANSNGENQFEKDISDFFEIYVCESQPKNIFEYGQYSYHDGYEYLAALKRRNFTNLTLIPDAIAGNLVTQYYNIKKNVIEKMPFNKNNQKTALLPHNPDTGDNYLFPVINYLIFGANGMDSQYVYHSAGHLTPIYCALQKGRTHIVLTSQSSKFVHPDHCKNTQKDRSIKCGEKTAIKEVKGINYIKHYKEEQTRDTFFTECPNTYFNTDFGNKKPENICVYTPSEDKIRFFDIDYLITEFQADHIESLVFNNAKNWEQENKATDYDESYSDYKINRRVFGRENKREKDCVEKFNNMGQYIAPYLCDNWHKNFKEWYDIRENSDKEKTENAKPLKKENAKNTENAEPSKHEEQKQNIPNSNTQHQGTDKKKENQEA